MASLLPTFVRESGPPIGVPVLLLHGQMLDGSLWDEAAARLGATRRVLVPDLPGYGRTAPLDPFTLARVGEWLEGCLLERGARTVDVGAYSLGAYHALSLALRGRITVRRLHLLAPFAGADADLRRVLEGYAAAVQSGLDAARAFVAMALPEGWATCHAREARQVEERVRSLPARILATELLAAAAADDLRPRLAALRVPTVVRAGDADLNVPLAAAGAVAAAIPGARLEVAPGVGHLPLVQDRVATLGSIEAFLA